MKKIFGGIDLSYKKIIISSIIIGILVGLLNSIPFLNDTTITDIATNYEFWVFCGIFIIMNSRSCKDSALKCFLFFLISQPLIYLVEVPFSHMGWGLFSYYPYWALITALCLPMGYIGYLMKKDKWYGLLILTPMLILTSLGIAPSLNGMIYSFPHHIINLIFILASLILYPLLIFKNKKLKYIGLLVSALLIIIMMFTLKSNNHYYETIIGCSDDEVYYDNNYSAYLNDTSLGKVEIKYDTDLEAYCLYGTFYKTGKTNLIIDDKNDDIKEYELHIGKNTYTLKLNN